MKFYDHQQKIIDDDPTYAGLFLGTGSGKTRTALALSRGATLVICPKTQKEDGNWEREWRTLHEDDKYTVSLTTLSKETFRRDWELLSAYDTVIVDEAHTVLGVTPNTRQRSRVVIPKTSQLFEALQGFLDKNPPKRLYLATATIMKSPFTVWGAGVILGKIDGSMESFYVFRNKYYTRLPMPGREVWSPRSSDSVKDELASMVRSLGYVGRLEDFFDVPDQNFKTDWITLTERQHERIKSLTTEFPEAIVRVGKKHQVENGVLSGDEFSAPEYFDNAKIDKILDYAIEFPRIVIFAKYRAQIEQIQAALTKAKYKVLTMTGDTKDRGAVILEANISPQCVFIVQAQMSAGWELPGPTKDHPEFLNYNTMIFASRTYSFVDHDQGLGRIQRSNNIKKNLYIFLVVKGGVDEAVHDSLLNKTSFNERIYANA